MGTVANLAVRISANAQEFDKTIAGMETQVSGLSGTFAKIGAGLLAAFSFDAITAQIERIGDWGGQIVDFSNRLGLSIETIQRFKFAAEQGGSSIETIGRAIEFANRKIASGDEGFAEALREIGVSVAQLTNQAPEQRFITMARALNEIEDPAKRDALAFELFGRAGQEIQQFLPTLIADLSRAPVAADALAHSADDLGDSWDRLKSEGEIAIATVGTWAAALADSGINIFEIVNAVERLASGFNALTNSVDLSSVTTIAENNAKAWRESGIHVKTFDEVARMAASTEKEMDASIRKTNQARKESQIEIDKQTRAQERQDAQWRQTMNFIGEELMKADKARMDFFNNMGTDLQFMLETTPKALLSTQFDVATQMAAIPGQVVDNIRQVEQVAPIWNGILQGMRDSAADAFTGLLFHTMSFKDGFVSIWQSLKQSLMDIVNDIIHNVLGRLINGIANVLTGSGSFGSAFGGLGGMLGGLLGFGGKAGGGAAGAAGAAGAGGGGGLGGFFTNPWTAIIGGAAALGLGIWKGGLFRGGEEALQVNPARDAFFRDFQDRFGGDQQAALATAFAERGIAGDVADRMIKRLYEADTMKEFEAATAAINKTLEEGVAKSTEGNTMLGSASTLATQAVNSLTTALGGLTEAATTAADARMISELSGLGGFQESGGITGGFLPLPDTFEEIPVGTVNPDDMASTGVTNVVNLAGMIYGSPQELEDAVGRAYNNSIERGGSNFQKARALQAQLAT